MTRVSLVIPAYNSARYIGESLREALAYFDQRGIDGEIIVADDGSRDGTAEAARVDPRVQVVRLDINRGKGAALRAGMRAASGSVRAFTDADLPYGPEPVLLALHYIEDRRLHAVLGDRTLPGSTYAHEGPLRSAVSGVASFAFRTLVTGGIFDTQCGFKAFRGDVAAELFRLTTIDGFAIDVELIYLLLKYRLDVKRVPVQLRHNESSTVRVIRDSVRASRDIGRIRINWAAGRYRSTLLQHALRDDIAADIAEFQRDLPVAPDESPSGAL